MTNADRVPRNLRGFLGDRFERSGPRNQRFGAHSAFRDLLAVSGSNDYSGGNDYSGSSNYFGGNDYSDQITEINANMTEFGGARRDSVVLTDE